MSNPSSSLLVDPPSLTSMIVAVVEYKVSSVSITVTVNPNAFASEVLKVSVVTSNPLDLLSVMSGVSSDDNSVVDSETNTSLVSNNVVSLQDWSQSFCS